MRVKNLSESIDFYERVFGFEMKEDHTQDGDDAWAIVTGQQLLSGESPDCAMTGRNRNTSGPRIEGNGAYEGLAFIQQLM